MAFKKTGKTEPEKTNIFKKKNEEKAKTDNVFVGGGWDNTGKYGVFCNIQLKVEDIEKIEPDKYGNIKLTIGTRKEKDEISGQDLYVKVSN